MPLDYSMLHRRMMARFEPKRRDDLKPETVPFIGAVMEWECWDYGNEDNGDPYPGQYRWFTTGPDRERLPYWVPDEDLVPCATPGA